MRERKYRSQFFNVFPWSNVPGLGYICESTFLFLKCFRWQASVLCALLSAAIAHNGVGSGSRGYLFTVVFSTPCCLLFHHLSEKIISEKQRFATASMVSIKRGFVQEVLFRGLTHTDRGPHKKRCFFFLSLALLGNRSFFN